MFVISFKETSKCSLTNSEIAIDNSDSELKLLSLGRYIYMYIMQQETQELFNLHDKRLIPKKHKRGLL